MIKVENVSHSFDVELFKDINFEVLPKESLAIIGRSGSGKSTLLHILSSFLEPDKGSVKILGIDLYKDKNNLRRKDIGIIFQDHFLINGMTVRENLLIAQNISNNQLDNEMLKKFGVYSLLNKRVSDLSGGQKQRVSIIRVLIKKPKIVFADEITANLDVETRDIVIDIIFKYIEENSASLILVTHDMKIADLCSKKLKI